MNKIFEKIDGLKYLEDILSLGIYSDDNKMVRISEVREMIKLAKDKKRNQEKSINMRMVQLQGYL